MSTCDSRSPPKGNTAEWYTRKKDFLPLHEEFGFTIDVCAANQEASKLARFFCPPDVDPVAVGAVAADGLAQPWKDEIVWCNPGPYDVPTLNRWGAKCVAEAGLARTIVLTAPAWPDRPWWQDFIEPGRISGTAEVRFPRGRWRFGWPGCPDGRPGFGGMFPQAIVIWRRAEVPAALQPQPAPLRSGSPAVWPMVVADLRSGRLAGGYRPAFRERLVELARHRDTFGTAKYGVQLEVHNGREPLADALQEALDLCAYTRQEYERTRTGSTWMLHETAVLALAAVLMEMS